ncbi:hypothetical protein PHYC_03668 [Phycisphaerales bacterium]|nr:hypothetical protein PHYC_03668 [Phycisphaerales bacterium]
MTAQPGDSLKPLHRAEALVDREGHVTGPEGVMVMPGSAQDAAAEIKEVSSEGSPADAKLGPRALRMILIGGWVVLAGVAVVVAFTVGWPVAVAMLAFGTLVFLFNPVVFAAVGRAKEREEALTHHFHVVPPHDEADRVHHA